MDVVVERNPSVRRPIETNLRSLTAVWTVVVALLNQIGWVAAIRIISSGTAVRVKAGYPSIVVYPVSDIQSRATAVSVVEGMILPGRPIESLVLVVRQHLWRDARGHLEINIRIVRKRSREVRGKLSHVRALKWRHINPQATFTRPARGRVLCWKHSQIR